VNRRSFLSKLGLGCLVAAAVKDIQSRPAKAVLFPAEDAEEYTNKISDQMAQTMIRAMKENNPYWELIPK
jgi:hypothetical protein